MIKKYLQYIKEDLTTDVGDGDLISYELPGTIEEIWGEILEIITIFRSYDDIETNYIVSDLANDKTHLIMPKNIIRKLTDIEIDSIKYNL